MVGHGQWDNQEQQSLPIYSTQPVAAMLLFSHLHTVAMLGCAEAVSSQTLTSTPTTTLEHIDRRVDPAVNADIPTFTFRSIKSYFVKDVSTFGFRTQFNKQLISDSGPESPARERQT